MSAVADVSELHVRELLRLMLRAGASDLHLAAGMPPMMRVDGTIAPLAASPLSENEVAALSNALSLRGAGMRVPGAPHMDFAIEDAEYGSVRIHLYRAGGPRIAIRVLGGAIPSAAELGLPRRVLEFADLRSGLVVVCGASGSGKTTTVAALLDAINEGRGAHVITIEEPVEFRHRSRRALITQREIGRDVPDAATGIHAALREDPDVIFLGELRDGAAIETALTAAETGHLVLTTLHARGADAAVDRIIDLAAGERRDHVRRQLAQVLAGVVYQRLIRRAEGRGRVPAVEVLIATPAVRSLVREGKTHQLRNAMATGRTAGMRTLSAHLDELVLRGEVDAVTAREVAGEAPIAADG